MFQSKEFDMFFAETVTTLKPYLNDLVCIGGCANGLYRHHKSASNFPFPYLGTKDMDWASPQKLPIIRQKTIADLMKESGFKEERLGSKEQAVIKYLPRNESFPGDIEFLCPESGLPGGRNRNTTSPSYAVQPGLMAQPLRYLDLLLYRTWEIELGNIPEFKSLEGIRVRVPNPASYVMQKVLIREQRRSAQSAAKDCYYLYEVSVIFRDSLELIADESQALMEKFNPWFRKFLKLAEPLFSHENSSGPVSALKVFQETRAALGFNTDDLTSTIIHRSVVKLLSAMHHKTAQ